MRRLFDHLTGSPCGRKAVATDAAEQPAMLELHQTYGKTIHTWAIDETPDLPLGPPHLMMSFTGPGQANPELVKARDARLGMSTDDKRELREHYLPPYEKVEGADEWESKGKGIVFEAVEGDAKLSK